MLGSKNARKRYDVLNIIAVEDIKATVRLV